MIFNPSVETLSRPALEALQLRRLRRTLRWASERLPFYREAFAQAKITPKAIKSLEGLQNLPFTRKAHLREHYPFGLLAVPRDRIIRVHASSGTRGKPTVVGYTKKDIQIWSEVVARCLACAGAQPGDVLHVAYGYGLFTGGLGLHYGGELMGLTVIPVSSGNTLRQIMLLQDFGANGLACTPSFALHIGETMREMGVDPVRIPLRYGIFGAEPWTEAMRRQIESTLPLNAVDIYGLSEVIGPGVSCECAEGKDGLHVCEDHFLPEIVDPETGAPLPYGEEGELVFTSLTKEAFPVIRYRTGDISSLNPEPCKCGRTLIRMGRVKGRSDDMLIIKGVNLYPSQVEAVLLEIEELAPHYQLLVDWTATMPRLEVQVELLDRLVASWGGFRPDHPALPALKEKILAHLRSGLALSPDVSILPPKSIPRSEGKAVRVVEKKKE